MKKYFSFKSLFRGAISLQMALGTQLLTINSRAWAQATPGSDTYTQSYSDFRNSRKLEKQGTQSEEKPSKEYLQQQHAFQKHAVEAWGMKQQVPYSKDSEAVQFVLNQFEEQESLERQGFNNPLQLEANQSVAAKGVGDNRNFRKEEKRQEQDRQSQVKYPDAKFSEVYKILLQAKMMKADSVEIGERHAIIMKKPKSITEAMEASPRKLKDKLAKLAQNAVTPGKYVEGAYSTAKYLGGKTKEYSIVWPVEMVKMGLVIGGMAYYKLMTDLASDPAGIERFIDGQMDPITQFGLLAFIVANHEGQAFLQNLMAKGSVFSRLYTVQMIPYLSMSAGMMAQSLLAEIAHDKDLLTCARGYAGYADVGEVEKDKACDKTLETWYYEGRRNKLDSWTPSLISMMASTYAAAQGQRLVFGGIGKAMSVAAETSSFAGKIANNVRTMAFRMAGIEVGASLVPGAGWTLKIGQFIGGMIQFAGFMYLDHHFFSRPILTNYQTFSQSGDLEKASKNIVANLLNKKVAGWKADERPGVCKAVRGPRDEQNCYLDLQDQLKQFGRYAEAFRAMRQSGFHEKFYNWQTFVDKINTQYSVTEQTYHMFIEKMLEQNRLLYKETSDPRELRLRRANIKLTDINPYAGIRFTPSETNGEPDNHLLSGSMVKEGQRLTLDLALKEYNATTLKQRVGLSNMNLMMAKRLEKNFEALKKEETSGEALADIRKIIAGKIVQQGNEPELYHFLESFLKKLGNPIPAMTPGLWWWGEVLNQKQVGQDTPSEEEQMKLLEKKAEEAKAKAANENSAEKEKIIVNIEKMKKNIQEQIEKESASRKEAKAMASQLLASQSPQEPPTLRKALISSNDYFPKSYGIFHTPTAIEYILVSMICGPDITKGQSVIEDQKGYYSKFRPFRLAYSKDDFGGTCSDIGIGSAQSNVYTTPIYFTRDGKKYKEENIFMYLSKHIDPVFYQVMNDGQARYISEKVWENKVQPYFQAWFQKYNTYYREVVVEGVRQFIGLDGNDKMQGRQQILPGSALNQSWMDLRPLESLRQERRLYLLILNEMLKDQVSSLKKAGFESLLQKDFPEISTLPAASSSTIPGTLTQNAHFIQKTLDRQSFVDNFPLLSMTKNSPVLDLSWMAMSMKAPDVQKSLGPIMGQHAVITALEEVLGSIESVAEKVKIEKIQGQSEIRSPIKFQELAQILNQAHSQLIQVREVLFPSIEDLNTVEHDVTLSRAYRFNNYQLRLGRVLFENLEKNVQELSQFLSMQVFMDFENRSKINEIVQSTLEKTMKARSRFSQNYGQ